MKTFSVSYYKAKEYPTETSLLVAEEVKEGITIDYKKDAEEIMSFLTSSIPSGTVEQLRRMFVNRSK